MDDGDLEKKMMGGGFKIYKLGYHQGYADGIKKFKELLLNGESKKIIKFKEQLLKEKPKQNKKS